MKYLKFDAASQPFNLVVKSLPNYVHEWVQHYMWTVSIDYRRITYISILSKIPQAWLVAN